jgi:hypothetical protein
MIEPHPLGDVAFPAGQVVGCDPLMTRSPSRFRWRRAPARCGPGSRPCTGDGAEQVPGAAGAVTDEPSGANVILVSSGWGDGAYPTFVGYAAAGEVSSFVTDFMVVPAG